MEHSPKSATTAKDPVCGMSVEPSAAKYKFDYAGKSYYFCCASCMEKFRARPEEYLALRAPAGLQTIGIAPAPRLAKQSGLVTLGAEPSALPSAAIPSSTTPAYVCPMCPEVR